METYSNYNPNTQTDLTQPTSEGSPASATNPPDSYPDSSSKISITNDKDYDIVLHPLANADQSPINSGPITIPAGQTTEIDIAALTGSESWAGNFEIRAAETNEPTGAMLEVATNQDIGAGEPSTYFNISYINGVPHNSNEEDFINTKAYYPDGQTQGNDADMNQYLNYGKLSENGTLMKPSQNGELLSDVNGGGNNAIAQELLNYREQTGSSFYLYTGTSSANYADDELSQSFSGTDSGMSVVFY
ncbi:MAG TPA: hypothetical protein DHW71_00940 [Gammaproteobacteria bacterium]|nr:hypothetical protein [Gammaproteobacteria bacterium]MEC8009915.1 hypothetical protein [Pseudomonadota bacterium]HBF06682.1 hypothetical protein [Gammaproteobacteria bacterium]HCK91515.1 hypothetical protein [Gammaproteobacteria bacterium]|tara:strand:- start:31238 stop:31975 length:738 start_codon:yes stop_codon:yes gene_type:complete